MTKEQFMKDLQAVYLELQDRQAELNGFYDLIRGQKNKDLGVRSEELRSNKSTSSATKAKETVEAFLQLLDLPYNDDTVMAALTRIVNLREDALVQVMEKAGLNDEEIRLKKELAYGFASMLHIARHESLIGWIEEHKLLTPFYRGLIFGVHFVGLRMSEWQSHWTDHIIHSVNLELSELFNGDDAKVFEMLQGDSLLDKDESGCVGDRCYSVLKKKDTGYQSVAYAEAFPKEVEAVVISLEQLIALLGQEEDEVFGRKEAWITYFTRIKEAFAHTKVDELIAKWADVDRAWMQRHCHTFSNRFTREKPQ